MKGKRLWAACCALLLSMGMACVAHAEEWRKYELKGIGSVYLPSRWETEREDVEFSTELDRNTLHVAHALRVCSTEEGVALLAFSIWVTNSGGKTLSLGDRDIKLIPELLGNGFRQDREDGTISLVETRYASSDKTTHIFLEQSGEGEPPSVVHFAIRRSLDRMAVLIFRYPSRKIGENRVLVPTAVNNVIGRWKVEKRNLFASAASFVWRLLWYEKSPWLSAFCLVSLFFCILDALGKRVRSFRGRP